jgi:hypothetical protein
MLLDEIWNKVLNPIHTLHPYRAKVFFSLTVLAPVGKQFKVHSAVVAWSCLFALPCQFGLHMAGTKGCVTMPQLL